MTYLVIYPRKISLLVVIAYFLTKINCMNEFLFISKTNIMKMIPLFRTNHLIIIYRKYFKCMIAPTPFFKLICYSKSYDNNIQCMWKWFWSNILLYTSYCLIWKKPLILKNIFEKWWEMVQLCDVIEIQKNKRCCKTLRFL